MGILTDSEINTCTDIAALRAHVVACGYSGAWFDANTADEVIGELRAARACAWQARQHRIKNG